MFYQLKSKIPYLVLLLITISPLPVYGAAGKDEYRTSGERIYVDYCSVCHGDKGDGKSFIRGTVKNPPPDFTDTKNSRTFTFERMKRSVYYGRTGTAMVAWRYELTDDRINDVIAFIRKEFMKPDGGDKRPEDLTHETLIPESAWGSPTRYESGKETYMLLCFQCHGVNGDGDMPVKDALLSPPRDFTLQDVIDTLDPNQMFYGVKNGIEGSGMPAWKFDLTDEQIIDVIVYIKEGIMGDNP